MSDTLMHSLFRFGNSIYGGKVMIGASFDLLPYFIGAGAAFIVGHAVFKLFVPNVQH